nr:Rpn family recombination-promoting nuclease/putative transposase [Candidatus Arsenophonus triatominarum]
MSEKETAKDFFEIWLPYEICSGILNLAT